jgi:glycosyltransferase involved in cell wall biosynthesis
VHVTTIPLTQWLFLRGQNRFLRERGFEVHAVSSPGEALGLLAERDGVQVHAVPISRVISPLADLVSLARLYALLRRLRPHMVHVSTPKAALLGSIAAWLARVPVRVFFVRGLITEGAAGGRRRLFRALEALTSRLCTRTVCVAPSLLELARREGIVRPGDGWVAANGMSNGLDPARFAPGPVAPGLEGAGPVVGFVGRLARDKGVEELAEAWRALRAEFPDARLLLVGPWEAEDAVAAPVRAELEADPRVRVTGLVPDVVPYLRGMSVFAFPSHGTEGFPNAPMEAAAAGLPVVVTRVVGCVDAVQDGVTGTVVPPRDAGALAAALRRYLADPGVRAAHGAAGQARALRDFRNEAIWEALYAEYVRLLRAHGQPLPASRAARLEPAAGAA